MRRLHPALATLALPMLSTPPGLAQAGTTELVSVDSNGVQGNLYSTYNDPSGDGRRVAFQSESDNLVPTAPNLWCDIFLRDRQAGTTTLVSRDSAGTPANGNSVRPVISEDGRFVAWQSDATNLVPGDTNSKTDVFVHDSVTGQTQRASVSSGGAQGNFWAISASISGDGRFVAFHSRSTNLVPGDTNSHPDIFVRDLLNGTTERVSVSTAGAQATHTCESPAISADGDVVAFSSSASNLVPGDTNLTQDVFVHVRSTGVTTRASVASGGAESNGWSDMPALSSDGRFVVFESGADNLVPGDTNLRRDIFVHDRATGNTSRVSVDSLSQQANQSSFTPSISAWGRFVAFGSLADNLVPGDTNASYDAFVHDRVLHLTTRVSVDSTGVGANQGSNTPRVAANGTLVTFSSSSDNLVPGDANGESDVFAHDLGCPTAWGYCAASATSIAGCQASISGIGTPSLADPAGFTITSGSVPGGNLGLLFFGAGGPAELPFGTLGGLVCVAPPTLRTAPKSSGGSRGVCDGQYTFTLADLIAAGPVVTEGAILHAEVWARDPANADGFLLSNGLQFTVCP